MALTGADRLGGALALVGVGAVPLYEWWLRSGRAQWREWQGRWDGAGREAADGPAPAEADLAGTVWDLLDGGEAIDGLELAADRRLRSFGGGQGSWQPVGGNRFEARFPERTVLLRLGSDGQTATVERPRGFEAVLVRRAGPPGAPPVSAQPACAESGVATGAWRPAGAEVAVQMGGKTRLLILRHGETAWNREGRVQGQTDTALNENGQRQARGVAEALRRLGLAGRVSAVVSSDLTRARETADAIAGSFPGARRSVDAGLREIHCGNLQGQLATAAGTARAALSSAWMRGQLDLAYPGPGGESPAAVIGRGLGALRCAARLGSCVVVVSHGGTIKWCAVAIELGTERPSQELLESSRATRIFKAQEPNCCCSTVIYDHRSDSFSAESWFAALDDDNALDDTG